MQLESTIDIDDHPDSVEEAYEILRDIREKELKVVDDDFERRQKRTQSFHDYIQRQLDHPAQVLPELIQNADDIKSCNTVEIELTDDTLRIRNDGRPMKSEEVDTLCAAGQSTKQDPEYIGHFGLGFKSVFSISDSPRVRSGYFHFEFDSDRLTVPEIHDVSTPVKGTEIELPLKEDLSSERREQLQDRLDEVHRLLTYLRNVSQIEITQEGETTVYRRESDSESPERIIYKDDEVLERRLVFTTDDKPSGEAFEQLADKRQIDEEETVRESPVSVTLSFEVDDSHRPCSKAEDCYLFNFLPTDERSGFPFDVHADFLLEPNRRELAWKDGPYNQWLLNRVGDTYRKVIKYYRGHDATTTGHLLLLPSQSHGLDHTEVAKESVLRALSEEASIPGQDGDYHCANAIVVPTFHVESVFTKPDVRHLLNQAVEYPAKSIDEPLLDTLLERGLIEEVSVESLLKRSESSAREDFSEASTAHLLAFAAALWEYWKDEYRNLSTFSSKKDARDEFKRIVEETPLIPLENRDRVAISAVDDGPLLPPKQNREVYDIFEDEFQLVQIDSAAIPDEYPENAADIVKTARKFYSNVLEIETVGAEVVLKDVVAAAFENVETTDDATLDTFLEYIFSNKSRWSTAKRHVDLKFRVRSDANKPVYQDPSSTDIFLPDVYCDPQGQGTASGYSLEDVLEGLDATFVSEEYESLTGEEKPRRWKEFLTEFGVLDRLPVNEVSRRKRTFYTYREELKEDLSDITKANLKEGWSIPDSRKKGGAKDQWFPQGKQYGLSDYVPGDWFSDVLDQFAGDGETQIDRAEAFDQMLQAHWSYYQEKLCRPLYYVVKGRAFRVKKQQTDHYSTFGQHLRSTPWCLTKGETLAKPRTLLVENPATANQPQQMYVAHENSPYLTPLGVKTQLGIDVTLEQLSNAPSVWSDADPPTVRQELTSRFDTLQQELRDDGSDVNQQIRSALSDARFIYVEGADPEFRSPSEVVWSGQNLGSHIISIEGEYGKYEDLLQAVDIRDSIQLTDYLGYLADAAWDSSEHRDTVWRRIVRQLIDETSEVASIQELGSKVRDQLTQRSLLALSNEMTSLDQLEYYCHDEIICNHLRSELENRVVKPYDGRDYAKETVAEAWEVLELEDLTANATLSLSGHNVTVSEGKAVAESEEFTQLFTVAYSFCLNQEHEKAQDKLLQIFSEYQIAVHEAVKCQYLSAEGEPITDEFDVQCYLDQENQQIRRTEGTASLQEFTQRLPNELPLTVSEAEELESILSGALGKRERFLDSFLETFGVERRSIEAEIQPASAIDEEPSDSADEEVSEGVESDEGDETGPTSSEELAPSGNGGADSEVEAQADGSSHGRTSEAVVAGPESETPGSDKEISPGGSSSPEPSPGSSAKQGTNQSPAEQHQEGDEGVQSGEEGSKPVEEDGEVPKRTRRGRTFTSRPVRDSEFREAVRDAYSRTCAVCGNRRETKEGQLEIEAAHIKPVSEGGPDSVQNGVALCRLHHWAFENGWITFSNGYEVLVRDWESVPGYEEFSEYEGDSIRLPDKEQQQPGQRYLKYHRQSHGFEE